jgi:hypothetical protein
MRAHASLGIVALLAFASPARAENTTTTATAQSLFDRGKAAMAKGDYATACPLFAESQRAEPSGGTILHLALCHEGEGKTATAWTEFHAAVSFARRDGRADREKVAREHITALEPKLTKLVVAVPKPAPGLEVRVDGAVVVAVQWGTPTPVDPGAHAIDARAPGKKAITAKVDARGEGATTTYTLGELESDAPTQAPLAPPTAPSATPVETAPAPASAEPSASRPFPLRTVGLVTAGVGVVAVGVGAYFGLVAKSKLDDSNAAGGCTGNTCPQTAFDLRNDSISAANASTVLFVAGGVLVATGVTLWVAAPRGDARTAARVDALPLVGRTNGVAVRARW